MILLCVDFIVSVSWNILLLENLCEVIPILFHLMTIKRMKNNNISTLKINMAKENVSVEFRLKQIDEA